VGVFSLLRLFVLTYSRMEIIKSMPQAFPIM